MSTPFVPATFWGPAADARTSYVFDAALPYERAPLEHPPRPLNAAGFPPMFCHHGCIERPVYCPVCCRVNCRRLRQRASYKKWRVSSPNRVLCTPAPCCAQAPLSSPSSCQRPITSCCSQRSVASLPQERLSPVPSIRYAVHLTRLLQENTHAVPAGGQHPPSGLRARMQALHCPRYLAASRLLEATMPDDAERDVNAYESCDDDAGEHGNNARAPRRCCRGLPCVFVVCLSRDHVLFVVVWRCCFFF